MAALVSLIVCLSRGYRKISHYFEEQSATLSELKRHDKEQYLAILRLTIVSEEMPLSERIRAGDCYFKEGGNGGVHRLYESLLKESHLYEKDCCKEEL